VVLQDAGVAQRALDHGVGAGLAVLFQEIALQRAGVNADAHGASVVAGGLNHLADAVGGANVAGIDPQAGSAGLGRLDPAFVVEVDVGHERDLGRLGDRAERRGGLLVGTGDPHDVCAGLLELADLVDGRGRIGGQRIGHRLDGDRRIATHLHGADADLAARPSLDRAPRPDGGVIFVGVV